MLHAWRVFGYEAAEREFRERWDTKHRAQGSTPPQFFEVIRGKLSFLAMVRGREDKMYTELVHRARRLDGRFNGVVTRDDAVVVIDRDGDAHLEDGIESQGTGFVLAGVGLVTAGHVVCASDGTVLSGMKAVRSRGLSEAANVRVFLPEYGLDFAVCQIPFKNVPALQLGDPATVRRGDTVTILGFPHWSDGHTVTETQARVVGRTRRHNADRIDLDTPMHRGNSGGPVLDRNGKVVGVAVTGSNDGEFPNSAIPISLVRERAHQLGLDLAAESAYREPAASPG
jgi:RNA-directed DNA polymerase